MLNRYKCRSLLKDIIFFVLVFIFFISCKKDNGAKTPSVVLPVDSIVCVNGGTLLNDSTCLCPAGYEGANCAIVSNQKFLGNWQVFEKGSTTNATQYEIAIIVDTPVTKVAIVNFHNYFIAHIIAYVNHDTLTIPNQESQGKIIFGVGYIYSSPTYGTDGAISMKYEFIDTATGSIDDYGYYAADLSNPSNWNK